MYKKTKRLMDKASLLINGKACEMLKEGGKNGTSARGDLRHALCVDIDSPGGKRQESKDALRNNKTKATKMGGSVFLLTYGEYNLTSVRESTLMLK